MKLGELSEFSHQVTVQMTMIEYENLLEMSKDDMRTPENTLRWLIKQEMESRERLHISRVIVEENKSTFDRIQSELKQK